jgi:hypothetical protein
MPLITNVSYRAFFPPFDLSGFTLDSQFSLAPINASGNPTGLNWNNDGTKAYVVDQDNKHVYQYALSAPYDITDASATYETFGDIAVPFTTTMEGGEWKSDGATYFAVSGFGAKLIEYDANVAFDISTISYDSVVVNLNTLNSSINSPTGVVFNDTGSKMFIVNGGNGIDGVYEFNLGTNWDITTAVFTSFLASPASRTLEGIKFQVGGRSMSVTTEQSVGTVYTYTLTTSYDITSATLDSAVLVTDPPSSNPRGLAWNPAGNVLYICAFFGNEILKYVKT